jgi:4-hydroxythreonine-4-phosphate dehydrogenase
MSLRKIGVVVGDPAGVGPEIVEAALRGFEVAGVEFEVLQPGGIHEPGKPTRESALAAAWALEESARRCLSREWCGVVTGPVCKNAMHAAGFKFPGQTEFFAERAGVLNFAMCLTGGPLTVALVTAHVPLARVAGLLDRAEIVRVGKLLRDFLVSRGISRPRIAVAGLNPHAGEGGDIGSEEIEVVAPAVAELAAHGSFTGPYAPDTVFHRAVGGEFDGVLCMYHDQGLIPLKLLAFHEGVNVTLGLPFVRTSPDHGTAFDIAGKGVARCDSMRAALRLAAEMVMRR